MRLCNKLLGQEYEKERLRSSLRKFYGRYWDLINQYEALLNDMFLKGIGYIQVAVFMYMYNMV